VNSFIDRPWWTIGSVLLMVAWLAFLVAGTRTKQSYLLEVAPRLPRGGFADWQNKDGKLILSGWSLPEANFRWSDDSSPSICLKPEESLPMAPGGFKYSIGLELAAIDALKGKDVGLMVDGAKALQMIRMQPDWSWYWVDAEYPMSPEAICVVLNLPFTSAPSQNDSRHLGVRMRVVELR
jgi:hypothetical protein